MKEKEKTLENWKPLIIRVISKYSSDYPIEESDLYQECCIKFLRCVELYDPKREVKFLSYLYTTLERTCWQFQSQEFERKTRFKSWPQNEGWKFDQLLAVDDRTTEKLDATIDLNKIIDLLDERTQKIMRSYILGETLKTIGEEHGVSKERIRQIVEATKEKIINQVFYEIV